MLSHRPLPRSFNLRNPSIITSRGFEQKENPCSSEAYETVSSWFRGFQLHDPVKLHKFMDIGRFDVLAALSFPNADLEHLETCIAFLFWAFSTDDLADSGELQSNPDEIEAQLRSLRSVLYEPSAPRPEYAYGAMLFDFIQHVRASASQKTYLRLARGIEEMNESIVCQTGNRSFDRMPTAKEFIDMRRGTGGTAMAEAMIQYSLDLDLPEYVLEDPVVVGLSVAAKDIMCWPNDLCSFNKEQAEGDFQNLVCCVMVENDVGLQEAVDILTEMLKNRVEEYIELKSRLPSFGPSIDADLQRYLQGLEHFVQGTIAWTCASPRYFCAPHEAERFIKAENMTIRLYDSRKNC